jgi:hypothetical protein
MKKNILLIEDNPDDVKLTLRAFEKNKILNEIVVKTDGVEGMEYLNRCTLLPALVLLDLQLPRMGGIEVLRRIRTDPRLKLLPVVIMTSSREERDVNEVYHLGANSFICKPVDFVQFTEVVRQLGMYWLLLNEPPPEPTSPSIS